MGSDGIHIAAGQHRILHAASSVLNTSTVCGMRGSEPLRKISSGLPVLCTAMVFPARSPSVRMLLSASTAAPDGSPCRSRPAVYLLAPIHGKAAPDAVDGTAFHQICFLLPIDRFKPGSISHAAERFGGDLHVDPGGNAVIVQINIGRIGIASHNELRKTAVLRVGSAAGSQTADAAEAASSVQPRRNTRREILCFIWAFCSPVLLHPLLSCAAVILLSGQPEYLSGTAAAAG